MGPAHEQTRLLHKELELCPKSDGDQGQRAAWEEGAVGGPLRSQPVHGVSAGVRSEARRRQGVGASGGWCSTSAPSTNRMAWLQLMGTWEAVGSSSPSAG